MHSYMAWRCSGDWISAANSLLITCCVVPLLFRHHGWDFYSHQSAGQITLIQFYDRHGRFHGALIGLPPPLAEVYGSDIRKMYRANGVPLSSALFPCFFRINPSSC